MFTIGLRADAENGVAGSVDLSFAEFRFNYEKCHRYETNVQVSFVVFGTCVIPQFLSEQAPVQSNNFLQVSLRSVTMEDLLQPEKTKQRIMVVSSAGGELPNSSALVSTSCPDIHGYMPSKSFSNGSLPDHLETSRVLGMHGAAVGKQKCIKPCTPPPSPSAHERVQQNLVIISSLIVDSSAPNFDSYYNSVRFTNGGMSGS